MIRAGLIRAVVVRAGVARAEAVASADRPLPLVHLTAAVLRAKKVLGQVPAKAARGRFLTTAEERQRRSAHSSQSASAQQLAPAEALAERWHEASVARFGAPGRASE